MPSRLRKNSLRLILGGAALQRCGNWLALVSALAAEVTRSVWKFVFPQPARISRGYMNHSQRKLTLWMLVFCLMLTVAISPALAKAQASSTTSAAKPAAQAGPSATPAAKTATKAAAGAPSSQDIAAAKASGKVWVNTDSGVYHKSGRWYGKTKSGKFMTEAEAKAAGYKEAQR